MVLRPVQYGAEGVLRPVQYGAEGVLRPVQYGALHTCHCTSL